MQAENDIVGQELQKQLEAAGKELTIFINNMCASLQKITDHFLQSWPAWRKLSEGRGC